MDADRWRLMSRLDHRSATFTRFAVEYLRAGQKDQALYWLERAFDVRDPNMPYLNTGPAYDGVRGDPRFQGLLRRMNLPS